MAGLGSCCQGRSWFSRTRGVQGAVLACGVGVLWPTGAQLEGPCPAACLGELGHGSAVASLTAAALLPSDSS